MPEDSSEGDRIAAVALVMSTSAGTDEVQRCTSAIDRLYGFLSVLDNKANALLAINALLVAIVGILILAPLANLHIVVPATAAVVADYVAFGAGAVAIVWSGINLFRGLDVFHIRWGFMKFVSARATREEFDMELRKLACEAARRQRIVARLRDSTSLVGWWSVLAIIVSGGRFVF